MIHNSLNKFSTMKKLLLIAVLFCSYGVGNAIAQGCAGKANAQAEKKESTAHVLTEKQQVQAIQVAAQLENIEANICNKSGNVSFAKISKCEASGKESSKAVNFDPETEKFVNVSPSEVQEAEAKKSSKGKEVKKRNCSGESSTSSARSSCAGQNKARACCSSRKSSSSEDDE